MSTEATGSASQQPLNEARDGSTTGRESGHVPSGGGAAPRSARGAWIIIGAAMVIGAVLGIFVYTSAADGSVVISHDLQKMRAEGAALDADGCVTATLTWFDKRCPAVGRMCLDAVPRMVGECLAAKDRTQACVANGNDMKPSQWAYHKCKKLGIDKSSAKPVKESCTSAWRALDSWCKSGQKGVAL